MAIAIVFNVFFEILKVDVRQSADHELYFFPFEDLDEVLGNQLVEADKEAFDLLLDVFGHFLVAVGLDVLMLVVFSDEDIPAVCNKFSFLDLSELFNGLHPGDSPGIDVVLEDILHISI